MECDNQFIRSCYSAPCKTILSGEHSVVYEEDALVIAVNLRTYSDLIIKPFEGPDAKLTLDFKEQKSISIIPFEQVIALIEGLEQGPKIYSEFIQNKNTKEFLQTYDSEQASRVTVFIYALRIVLDSLYNEVLVKENHNKSCLFDILRGSEMKLSVWSAVPISKGLGSSASYLTSLSAALLTGILKLILNKIKVNEQNVIELLNGEGLTLKKVINNLAYELEKIFHGTPSGIDTQITTYGGILLYNKAFKERIRQISSFKIDYELILIDSGVEKDTKRAVSNVREKYDSPVCGGFTKDLIKLIGKLTGSILEFLESKNLEDQRDLEVLIKANNNFLCALGLGHPKLTDINRICEEHGIAFKITGAGQGGYGLAFLGSKVASAQKDQFFKALSNGGYNYMKLEVANEGLKKEEIGLIQKKGYL